MRITPKNWGEFQHYKDRAPPWIKLHRGLLDDARFNRLTPIAAKALVLLWLVAADSQGGHFEDDPAEIAFRLRMPFEDASAALDELLAVGFLVDAAQAQPSEVGAPLATQIREKNGFGSRHISDKTKRAVWERDGGKCCQCSSVENLEYDHIHPVSLGGNSEAGNVQLLCRPCNRRKRAKTAEQIATQSQLGLGMRTTETETETETEKRQSKSAAKAPRPQIALAGNQWSGITPEQRHMWATAYPAVSLDIELSKALVWLHANPKNTKSNYERFLSNWLTRAQDKAPGRGASTREKSHVERPAIEAI